MGDPSSSGLRECWRAARRRLEGHPYYSALPARLEACKDSYPLKVAVLRTPWGPFTVLATRIRDAIGLLTRSWPLDEVRRLRVRTGLRHVRVEASRAVGVLYVYGEPSPLYDVTAVIAGHGETRIITNDFSYVYSIGHGGRFLEIPQAATTKLIPGGRADRLTIRLIRSQRPEPLERLARLIGIALARAHEELQDRDKRAQARITRRVLLEWTSRPRARLPLVRALAPPRIAREYAGLLPRLHEILREAIRNAPARPAGPSHGDLHLGQIIIAPGPRAALVDFEGEPYKYPADPAAPETPERDLATLARSLHYAARLAGGAPEHHGLAHKAWTTLLDAYTRAEPPQEPSPDLTRLWLIERATYELIYELTERTGLHSIPLEALQQLAASHDPLQPRPAPRPDEEATTTPRGEAPGGDS